MTQDELNAVSFSYAVITEGTAHEESGKVDGVDISFRITKAHWEEALTAASSAAVLVAWLEAQRTG